MPQKFSENVMRIAHDSLLAGHLGIQRPVTKVTSEFFWPGVQSDVRRFCQSCNICQRTLKKGKVSKVPLERMTLSTTDRDNKQCILTLVDYTTRYPEAIALPSKETERVAEALMDMF